MGKVSHKHPQETWPSSQEEDSLHLRHTFSNKAPPKNISYSVTTTPRKGRLGKNLNPRHRKLWPWSSRASAYSVGMLVIHGHGNLFSIRHITTNDPNLSEQSRLTILVDLSSYVKGNILTLQAIRAAVWNSVLNTLQATGKLWGARLRSKSSEKSYSKTKVSDPTKLLWFV